MSLNVRIFYHKLSVFARKNLASALKNVDENTLDLISIDLKESYENLGEITGTTTNEKILDSIFSKFCLGK